MSYIQDAIDILRRDGISVGWESDERGCVLHALCTAAVEDQSASWEQRSLREMQDRNAIRNVIAEQYPDEDFGSIGTFNDIMVMRGRQEKIFTVLEKALIKRQEEV